MSLRLHRASSGDSILAQIRRPGGLIKVCLQNTVHSFVLLKIVGKKAPLIKMQFHEVLKLICPGLSLLSFITCSWLHVPALSFKPALTVIQLAR